MGRSEVSFLALLVAPAVSASLVVVAFLPDDHGGPDDHDDAGGSAGVYLGQIGGGESAFLMIMNMMIMMTWMMTMMTTMMTMMMTMQVVLVPAWGRLVVVSRPSCS